jgi:hypothetical protein
MELGYMIRRINEYKLRFTEVKDRVDDEVYGLIEDLIADVEYMVEEYDALEESKIEEDQWRDW